MDTIVGQGEKNLVQITVDTTGLRPFWSADEGLKKPASPLRPKRGVIIATDAHPFWVAGNLNKWVNASDLKPGMWLRTSAGTYVQVTATKHWTTHRQRVHNLTVADLHTYYVPAGTASVLVHNDNEVPGLQTRLPESLIKDANRRGTRPSGVLTRSRVSRARPNGRFPGRAIRTGSSARTALESMATLTR